jgi:hypothetical protein
MKSLSISSHFFQIFQALNSEKCIPNFVKIGDANFVATNVKKIQNKDEKHLPWILCRGLGMFLKQLDQFILQYYSFKAEI